MKKLRTIIAGLSIAFALSGSVASADAHLVSVCHFSEGTGTYNLIRVGINSAHLDKHAEDFRFDPTLYDTDCVAL